MNEHRRSYSTSQLADALGVSVQTIQRWVDAGHIKAWKTVGGHRKIDAQSADEWIRTIRSAGGDASNSAVASVPLRVLVVDDDPAFVEVVGTLVADTVPGAVIEKAHSGFQALQAMAREAPDILVTDIVMPHIDGFEMLKHVAAQANRPALVIVTSVLAREDVDRRGDLPPEAVFLRKPLDQDAFTALLRLPPLRGFAGR